MKVYKEVLNIRSMLILLLVGSICIFSGLLINNIVSYKELNRLNYDNKISVDNDYVVLHNQFLNVMNCNRTSIEYIYTLYTDMYNGVNLEVGYSNDSMRHIYSHHYRQTIMSADESVITLKSKNNDICLNNVVISCYDKHIITLHKNMDITISGNNSPLILNYNVPLISYNVSDAYIKMIYKNDATSVIVTSTMINKVIHMSFDNYSNVNLPNKYCLTSISSTKFGRTNTRTFNRREQEYSAHIILKPVDIYLEICFDFLGGMPYMSTGAVLEYST